MVQKDNKMSRVEIRDLIWTGIPVPPIGLVPLVAIMFT